MPTTIRTAVEEFGAPKEIAGFVMPLGATMNMNGTALFEGVSVLFLAQVYGSGLDITQQAMLPLKTLTTSTSHEVVVPKAVVQVPIRP